MEKSQHEREAQEEHEARVRHGRAHVDARDRAGGHASIPICTYQALKKDDSNIRDKVMS